MSGQHQPGGRSSGERAAASTRPTQRVQRAAESSRETKSQGDRREHRAHHDSAEIGRPAIPTGAYPADLAREVRRRLKEGQKEHGPATGVLTHLFEILHFASMRTEEGQPVTCSVTYMDPSLPELAPRRNARPGRWSVTLLAHRVPLTVGNLVKLAAAADPQACSLAVHSDDAGWLYVWGMIDQEQSSATHETEKATDRPGLFQVTVAPAHIAVYRRAHLLASLVHGQLTHRFHDVFSEGPISRVIERYVGAFGERVRQAVGRDVYDSGDKRPESVRRLWVSTLSRVLLAIQAYRKGGAVLLIPPTASSEQGERREHRGDSRAKPDKSGLNVKYEIAYARLGAALERLAITRIRGSHARDRIWTGYLLDDDSGDLPGDLYLEEGLATSEEAACLAEIGGCIRFIASLSRADGLVLLEGDLLVKGFGVEITAREEPKIVLAAGDASGTQELCRPVDFSHFGLRHRSMMRYCDRTPGSVGFVVSQDGTIRALMKDSERLVLWDDIKLT